MAKKKATKKKATSSTDPLSFRGKKLVRFKRTVAGPPRRSTGQRVWLTGPQVKRYGYTSDDLEIMGKP